MREQNVSDGCIAWSSVVIFVRVRVRVGCPVKEEKSMIRVGLFVDNFGDYI